MTKEEVLQKVNDYCNEKSYTNETLTDEFKSNFVTHFVENNADVAIDDEGVLKNLKFSLDSAFGATSQTLKSRAKAFEQKEAEYKRQIEELKQAKQTPNEPPKQEPTPFPKELQEKLEKLEKFEIEARQNETFKKVLAEAKKSIRQDLHKSLENYASDFSVSLDEGVEEQAKKLTTRFQEIFKDSIGDVKPFSPKQVQKRDDEYLSTIPKIKIVN